MRLRTPLHLRNLLHTITGRLADIDTLQQSQEWTDDFLYSSLLHQRTFLKPAEMKLKPNIKEGAVFRYF